MERTRIGWLLACVVFLLGLAPGAWGAGFIVIGPIAPPRPLPPPTPRPEPGRIHNDLIQVRSQNVRATIRSGVAVTTVEQVFYNPNNRQLEGTYIFPLADDAAIGQFSMWMGGQEVQGELLEKDKARGIYEGIVRQMRDPALLEYVGRRMFKCRVFPIPACGEVKVKLSYTRQLANDAGLVEYAYPLRADANDKTPHRSLSVLVNVEASREILNLYSPTHAIDVIRESPTKMKVSFEAKDLRPDRNFKLFYNVSNKGVGLSLIPFRPSGEDGYFMAILTPRDEVDEAKVIGKDVVFVLDKSGSMLDDGKIFQAQEALKFCLASLREKDRFGLISFSTEATAYADTLQAGTQENLKQAINYVDKKIIARGGTAIDEALAAALKMNDDPSRPFMVVFLTDGEPTIGPRDPQAILSNVKGRVKENVRIFTFGVGYDVKADLLDTLASDYRGASAYVLPKENIEVKVGSFYAKVSSPVLTDATVSIPDLETYDVYPKQLGDLFRDQQVVVVGRYKGQGPQTIRLKGKIGAESKEYVYECRFPETEKTNDFLPRIWAMRKVGFLMDNIRTHGETDEVRQEIVHLSKRHGIMTPYTSWLVVEENRKAQSPVGARPTRPAQPPAVEEEVEVLTDVFRGHAQAVKKEAPAESFDMEEPSEDKRRIQINEAQAKLKDAAGAGLQFGKRDAFAEDRKRTERLLRQDASTPRAPSKAGEAAQNAVMGVGRQNDPNTTSRAPYRTSGDADAEPVMQHVGGKTFYRKGELWIDGAVDGAQGKRVKVELFSPAYFELLKKHPDLAPFFALGKRVVVVYQGTIYETVE